MTDFKAISSSLEERGFCVIPEFLSREEIDFLVEEFDACPDYAPAPRTKHAARHLGDKPVVGQTGALRSSVMGREVLFPRFTVIFTIFRGTTLKRETTRFSPMPLPHWVRNDETTVLVPTKSGICLTSTRLLLTMNPDGGA